MARFETGVATQRSQRKVERSTQTSREAATECSPRRKPWDREWEISKPRRGERKVATRCLQPPLDSRPRHHGSKNRGRPILAAPFAASAAREQTGKGTTSSRADPRLFFCEPCGFSRTRKRTPQPPTHRGRAALQGRVRDGDRNPGFSPRGRPASHAAGTLTVNFADPRALTITIPHSGSAHTP